MRVLLAVDNSPCSRAATAAVIDQNIPANTKVQILHVVDPFYHMSMYDSTGPASAAENIHQERLAQGEDFVKRTAAAFPAAGFDVKTRVEEGDPRTMILKVASEWNADLIVMGSHGRSGVDRFLLGSVSEAVTRHAHCSVEIIRDQSANQSAQEQGDLGYSEKCGHAPCTCKTKSGTYCSAPCEAMSQIPDIDCRCGHPTCMGRAH